MIRPAEISEAEILTRLSFESKGYWHYPEDFFGVWSDELTIRPDYIRKNDVFLFEKKHAVLGYYAIVELKDDIDIPGIRLQKGFWLEHLFINPQKIGTGIGTKLFDHLRNRCVSRGISELNILADPNSKGFYEKMGCTYKGEYPSTIKNRTTPFLKLELVNHKKGSRGTKKTSRLSKGYDNQTIPMEET